MTRADGFQAVDPGSTIRFADRAWRVKTSREPVGPGPNRFSAPNVQLDPAGRLKLSISKSPSGWTCAEVIGIGDFSFGTYRWSLSSTLLGYDPSTVLGLFTWSDAPEHANRELDIEFSRWGNAEDQVIGSYAVQRPGPQPPAMTRFAPNDGPSQHELHWSPGRVQFQSTFRGRQHDWSYEGADIPLPGGDVAPRMNLWLFRGEVPARTQTVTIEDFTYRAAV